MNPSFPAKKPGLVVLFGSGELTPTGRSIHELAFILSSFAAPVRVGILETPSGFETNALHGWPERMERYIKGHMRDWKPVITRIRAWRRDGDQSTNDPAVADAIGTVQYLYSGAGSPSYVIRHLRDTVAWKKIREFHDAGGVLCLGSASAVAVGTYAIPVYEIYKVGEDLRWIDGLDFFGLYGMNLAIVPHWNNTEGEDFDTTRCWMGEKRFEALRAMLPSNVTIVGIDETTACIMDPSQQQLQVAGTGHVHIIRHRKETAIGAGENVPFGLLRDLN